MDFITSLFSFIPLLMIVLFIVRFVAGMSKRKGPSPLNKLQAGTNPPRKPGPAPAPLPKEPDRLDGKNTDGIQPPGTGQVPANTAESEPLRKPEAIPEQESQSVLPKPSVKPFKKIDRPPLAVTTYTKPAPTKSRLSRLPELKKAVVWSEILGKPRGLE